MVTSRENFRIPCNPGMRAAEAAVDVMLLESQRYRSIMSTHIRDVIPRASVLPRTSAFSCLQRWRIVVVYLQQWRRPGCHLQGKVRRRVVRRVYYHTIMIVSDDDRRRCRRARKHAAVIMTR